ncbi:sensor domain-containing diguanylate cyclase [Nocardioides sambongensis]|uniref:sensor domain-containing diguanylate cyclase n=1 Tax=Nocardioides sambongensis TaxID=2589074 RepID=UPI001129C56D|nr:diguanylate cyclase [Nocardioides sambongensis]
MSSSPDTDRTLPLRRTATRTLLPSLVGLGASLLILVAVVVGLGVSVSPRIGDLRAAADAAQDAHDAMLDQQSGVRGYLATRDPSFLEPYETGREQGRAADNELVTALSGEPDLLADALAAIDAQQAWQEQWAAPATSDTWYSGEGRPTEDRLTEFLAGSKGAFDDYAEVDHALQAAIDDELTRAESTFTWALVVAMVTLAVVVGLSLFALLRGRQRLEQHVVRPIVRLTERTERIAAGDLTGEVSVRSPVREVSLLGAGIAEMTAALADRADEASTRESELVRRSERLQHVLELSRELSESLSLRYTTLRLVNAVQELSGAARVELWLHRQDRQELVRYDAFGAGTSETIALAPEETTGGEVVEVGIGAVGRSARYGRAIPLDERRSSQGGDATEAGVAIPMVIGARVIGVLTLEAADGDRLDLDLLDALILQGSSALQSARLHGEVEERSRRDALTGLANRRQFDEDLADNVARAVRYHRPLSMVMIDLDHFKRINDTYGHSRGDEVLQDVAALMAAELRDTDTAYRYGGEELCVLMPETDATAARTLAERLRARVAGSFPWASESPVSLSAGVAALDDARDPASLVGAADRALYAAKRGGRNRVELAVD